LTHKEDGDWDNLRRLSTRITFEGHLLGRLSGDIVSLRSDKVGDSFVLFGV